MCVRVWVLKGGSFSALSQVRAAGSASSVMAGQGLAPTPFQQHQHQDLHPHCTITALSLAAQQEPISNASY